MAEAKSLKPDLGKSTKAHRSIAAWQKQADEPEHREPRLSAAVSPASAHELSGRARRRQRGRRAAPSAHHGVIRSRAIGVD
jgi:hypothetical protein